MKKRARLASLAVVLSLSIVIAAQRPSTAPATAPSGKPPDTVLLEELTWAEARDLIKAGTRTIIVGTAGTEQKGPHMVDGEHKFVMEYTGEKIARALGKTLVAPVVTYVPEGSWENPTGHMSKPGTITLPDNRFTDLLVNAGRSLKAGGFQTILLIGESGGNRNGMRDAAAKLNDLWQGEGGARAFWIDDYYTKSHVEQNLYVTQHVGIPPDQIGGHANILDTSELLFVSPKHIRKNRLSGNDYENNGVSGNNQSKATPELGKAFLQIKIDNALAQIKSLMAGTITRQQSEAPGEAAAAAGRGGRGGGRGGRGGAPNAEPLTITATMLTAPASKTPTAVRAEPDFLPRLARGGVRLRRRHGRQPRGDLRYGADAVHSPVGCAEGSDQPVGRPSGLERVRRSCEGDRRDRPDGRRVQGQRRHQPVQAAQEPAAARPRPARSMKADRVHARMPAPCYH